MRARKAHTQHFYTMTRDERQAPLVPAPAVTRAALGNLRTLTAVYRRLEVFSCDNVVSRGLRSHSATFRSYCMQRLLTRQVLSFFISCTPNDSVPQPLTLRVISPILSKRRLRFPALSFRTRATIRSCLYLQAVSFFRHFVTSIYTHRNSFTREQGCIYP